MKDILKHINQETLIIMDTSFGLSEGIVDLYQECQWKLKEGKSKIIIPKDVVAEAKKVRKDALRKEDRRKIERVEEFSYIYDELARDGVVVSPKSSGKTHVDNLIVSKITELRLKYNIVLLTNDRGLKSDVLSLKNSSSTKRIKDIWVYGSNVNGSRRSRLTKGERSNYMIAPMSNKINGSGKNLMKIVDNYPKYIGNNSNIPTLKEIASGGEGKIYDTGSNVVKIYTRESIDMEIEEKLKLLIESGKRLGEGKVIFPKEIVYNGAKQCIGYTMDKVDGAITLDSYLRNVNLGKCSVKRSELVEISEEVVRLAKVLHREGIYVGDWNLKNILINPPTKEIYLIDTDSFQIDRYICPVGVMEFTDHEFLEESKGRYGTHFRNERNEIFALNTVIFQILMVGQKPYTRKQNEATNYKNRRFPYRFASDPSLEPEGRWKYIWHNLTHKLKESFWYTFDKGERYSLEWWEHILRGYRIEISRETVTGDLFPSSLKSKGSSVRSTSL